MHIFLSGIRGTGKSHFFKVIYNTISITLPTHCEDPDKPKSSFTSIYGNISSKYRWNHLHFGLVIKPGTKLLGLNYKSKAVLRKRLSEVKLFIIDQLSMVSSDLWTDIDSRLGEIFMIIPEKAFPALSAMTVANIFILKTIYFVLQNMF